MKYCSRCGKEIDDNAQFCPNCGANVIENSNYNSVNQQVVTNNVSYSSSQPSTLLTVAYVFSIIETVVCGFLLIPLAWMLPMTIHLSKLRSTHQKISLTYAVCNLIFLNLISGICLLCCDEKE